MVSDCLSISKMNEEIQHAEKAQMLLVTADAGAMHPLMGTQEQMRGDQNNINSWKFTPGLLHLGMYVFSWDTD